MSQQFRRNVFLPILLAAAGAPGRAQPVAANASRVPGYQLLTELGSGGMGTVYLALETGELRRLVALKVAHRDDDELARRLRLERGALAAVDHEHVARVYSAGETADGTPFFAMEYVAGEPIDAYCDRRWLGTNARLRMLAEVCDAVQHLHDRGIVHRDLKPHNVLVVERDGRPVPKVIDLGLAHDAGQSAAADEVVGTPAYMAPELFHDERASADPRADVYALGVLAYEVIAGVGPYPPADLRESMTAALRRGGQPPAPSERLRGERDLAAIAVRRGTGPRRLRRRLRRGVDRIVGRALAADRALRHPTAAALAADLRAEADRAERAARRGPWLGLGALLAAAAFALGALL